MKRLFACLSMAILLLTGCEKKPLGISLMNPTHASYKNVDDYYFIGAGQSNMSHESLTGMFPNSVNLAVGGTALWEWVYGSQYYNEIVQACKAQAKPCVLLFWQGEAEGAAATLFDWQGIFEQTMAHLRSDVQQSIPIIIVQIGQTSVAPVPYWKTIQQEQINASRAIPNCTLVSAADMFPNTGDGLHYGQDQYAVMQNRMYNAWENNIL